MPKDKQIVFECQIPDREPYEGKATQKQKQLIWELGYRDQAVIDVLGKKQASSLIDELKKFHKKQNFKYEIIAALAVLLVGALLMFWGFRSQH